MTWLKGHWQLLALTAAVAILWSTPVLLPLKILVVFFHEVSHGLAAIVSGGDVVSLSLSTDQGGVATTRGGSRFLILTSGYLGSLIIGVALLLAGLRSDADRIVVLAMGLVTLIIAALYIRDTFPLIFCLSTGAALIAASRFLPNDVNDLMLRIIGLTSMIYVPRDIFSDTIDRAHLRSDAFMMAEYIGGPTQLWGGLWLGLSIVVILGCLRFGLGSDSNIHWRVTRR